MSKRSRLSRRIENKSKKTLTINVVAILVILLLFFKLGLPFLLSLSYNFGSIFSTKSDKSSQNQSDTFVSPPILNSLPSATNSAQLTISGTAQSGYVIYLYVNGVLTDRKTASDNNFSFDETLTEGSNIIKAKASSNDHESNFSDEGDVNILLSPPSLNVDSPADGQQYSSSPIEVKGTTDQNASVTINGYLAIMTGNKFSYMLSLTNGDNDIKVEVVDQAGNKTDKEVKIKYSP